MAAQSVEQWCLGWAEDVRESDLSHNITCERRQKKVEKCPTIAVIMSS